MPWHQSSVFVIYDEDPEKLKTFFEQFGLVFKVEKHGDGPEHFACESSGREIRVLEIYPKKKKN